MNTFGAYISARLSRWDPVKVAATALFLVAVGLIYWPTFVWLVQIWLNDKEYSHGFLVPLVSLYLVWRKWEYLKTRPGEPSRLVGGGIVLASGLLFLAGRSGAFILAEALSFLVLLPGLVLFIWGWERLRVLAMPLFYLQFMVPWTEEVIERIHPPFQDVSALLGVALLKVTGVPVLLDGRYIHLPSITLEVARECSGIGFLLSVIALGLPLVYLTQTRWRRAVAVILIGALSTILVNGLRIALVGTTVYRFSAELLHGPFHVFQGWFVAQVGFVALVVVNWRVSRRSEPGAPVLCDRWRLSTRPGPILDGRSNGNERMATVVFAWAVVVLTYWYAVPVRVPLENAGKALPEVVGEWKGKNSNWIRGDQYFPGVDYQVARHYSDGNDSDIYFYLGYFELQKHGKSVVSFHANALREDSVTLDSDLAKGPSRVAFCRVTVNGVKYNVYYWYRLRSQYLAGRYAMKAWTIWHSLFHRRNNAAVYIVATPIRKGSNSGSWHDVRGFVERFENVAALPDGGI